MKSIKHISLCEAARRAEAGEVIKCLLPGSSGTWEDMSPADFNEWIDGVICFALEEDQEEKMTEEEKGPKPVKIMGGGGRTRKKMDTEKIEKLYKAGVSTNKIASEIGCSWEEVDKYVKGLKDD